MGTFAYYLIAAMIELDPPSKWEDIVEQSLIEMNCSTGRRKYCAEQLEKALQVGLHYGTIKRLHDKYYLYEYALVSPEGNITYHLDKRTFDEEEDDEEVSELALIPSFSSMTLLKGSQLTEKAESQHELQATHSNLVGPLTRSFLENYIIGINDDDSQEGSITTIEDDESDLDEDSSLVFIENLKRMCRSAPVIGTQQSSSHE